MQHSLPPCNGRSFEMNARSACQISLRFGIVLSLATFTGARRSVVETLPFLRPSRNRLGRCRCQAFALTGDAAHTDPACALSPDRDLLVGALSDAEVVAPEFIYRHHSAAAPDRHERFGERLPWPSVK